MQFGLTLPNRGVFMGAITAEQMLEMAEVADRSGRFDYLWVGDSLFGKPRMESVTLLAGVAARTTRVRIGPACMASFPLRDPVLLAYQWASVASWTATGSPQQCIEHLRAYKQIGFQSVGLRCTSWDQTKQLRRAIDEVLPFV